MKGTRIKGWLCLIPLLVVCDTNADVAQEPLFLGSGVPGNMAIVPSVEYPTVNSLANIDAYTESATFIGYFDPDKCYNYEGSVTESERHFFPVAGDASDHQCGGAYWSGNFLNWASMQTIDPFRWALTGGYRIVDEPDETWVQKARNSGQSGITYRTVSNGSGHYISNATPFSASQIIVAATNGHNLSFEVPADADYLGESDGVSSEAVYTEGFNGNLSASSDLNWGDFSYSKWRRLSGSASLHKKSGWHSPGNYLYGVFNIESGAIFSGNFYFANDTSNRDASFFIADNDGNGYGFYVYRNGSNSSIYIDILRDGGLVSEYVSVTNARIDPGEWYGFSLSYDGNNYLTLSLTDNANHEIATLTGYHSMDVGDLTRIYLQGGNDYYIDDFKVASYTPSTTGLAKYEQTGSNQYAAAVRVKVCDSDAGLEDNCKQYSEGWKPEGLMQEYAEQVRYSVFGYLNDSSWDRDGGVLRAQQKFIGQRSRDPSSGWRDNSEAEWDATTGVLIPNPDTTDANETESYYGVAVEDSGAMNYINKFGELNGNNYKTLDPVSELYYTATRYFRNIRPVPEYTSLKSAAKGSSTVETWVDNFPVIRDDWDDPIQYSCQKNVILGIGDVNTHRDQNLPGSSYSANEPARPNEVDSDTDIDVSDLNAKVGELEGINLTSTNFGATENAGYMIGLAYDAHTRDLRDDIEGSQTIDTYWVDVLENEELMGRTANQFWLTAKYGGFDPQCSGGDADCGLPEITGPYDADIPGSLPDHWWFTNGDILNQSNANLKRTDNYYPAGQADAMVDGLKNAFEDIAAAMTSTATAVSVDGDRLQTDSLVFQALFDTNRWSGDLVAMDIDGDGTVGSEVWRAADKLDALTLVTGRNIFTGGNLVDMGTVADDGLTTTAGRNFDWDDLTQEQRDALLNGETEAQVGKDLVNYIRGERDNEGGGGLRLRSSRLGDIVNSSPQYIYQNDYGYSALTGNTEFGDAGTKYSSYRETTTYQNKPPLVIAGANDGMLHGFNATEGSAGGSELFAYLPASIIGGLYELADPDYLHRYYVDGTPRLGDAWLGSVRGWRTLAVATTGAGGSSVFALDITDPESIDATSLLWEYTNPKMGLPVQQPSLVALANGKFGVVVSSGYESPQDEGYVWILDAADGSVIREFELPTAGGELGAPLAVDLQRDRISDRIYVGDTEGNLWRIDIDGSDSTEWGVPSTLASGGTPLPLFVARDDAGARQPITAPLNAAFNGNDDPMVIFGTGSFYRIGDEIVGEDPQIQSLYGIFDENGSIAGRDSLLEQTITTEVQGDEISLRTTSANLLSSSNKGWFMDLYLSEDEGGEGAVGERVVSRASLSHDLVVFSTLIPSSDPCAGGGSSWFLSVDYSSGSALSYQAFDVNGDGEFDEEDGVDGKVSSGFSNEGSGVSTGVIVDQESGGSVLVTTGSKSTMPKSVEINDSTQNGRIAWRELTD